MNKVIVCLLLGLLILTTGIYVSTFLTESWIIVGIILSGLGGILMGASSFFLPKSFKERYRNRINN
ncbi:hypothetical protein HU147_15145 [Planomicrobium chinense]|uniref:hypothetical protein n=1 Tax=Planococcus TaxID=1372 RepID=UPI001C72A33B|nr:MULTISPECIES: hypothetical protein [Planococcus]MBX0314056.1 hypothetical protein [Planococcus glaciei]MBZ5202542.1 hypothetical protein [Planococcus chinensis]